MNQQIRSYLEKYPEVIADMFTEIRQLIFDSVCIAPEETMWARLPSYYNGDKVVRLISFQDHINVEASAVIRHKDKLSDYKITPKGMLQIYANQDIPSDILKVIFAETLGS